MRKADLICQSFVQKYPIIQRTETLEQLIIKNRLVNYLSE